VSSSRAGLEVRGLSAAWERTPVLRSISLTVAPGEYFVLLGPNGSGKTTLLRCLAGLERPRAGSVILDGADLTDRPAHRRGIGLMFQDPALFAHRSVLENIAYAPLLQRRTRAEVDEEVARLVALLRLDGLEDRDPTTLSGGERQRVALARTLAARPRLVLLDEPFASIDPELKAELRGEFRRVLGGLGTAAIHVTHDREEGLFLGDRVGLLFAGELEAVGTPSEVYDRPATPRAARFLGYNLWPDVAGEVAVDPRDVRLAPDGPGPAFTVLAVGSVGRESVALLADEAGHRLEARWTGPIGRIAVGQRQHARWDRSMPLPPGPSD